MSRVPFVGGNFKCTGTASSLTTLIKEFNSTLTNNEKNVEVVVAPPACYLGLVKGVANREIGVAAQNCISKSGAFTGEMSAEQVKDMGLEYVILGHSERRHVFGETNDTIQKKVDAAIKQGLVVILCVGETLQEREAGRTEAVCFEQLASAVKNIPQSAWHQIVIAYEPVWAIGTGKVATPEQAQAVVSVLRTWLSKNISSLVSKSTRIIYGGSVNAKNCGELWAENDIDGFLVGGASTKPEYSKIVKTAASAKKIKAKL
eukprot:TRINITY_DN5837_c1_g2_i1.p1 TRINITY_DN5837_c1_g2~~TRINITY_DN5837_c1_g2_i1.p1  ORF type:complete len:260 (+),score=50.77 TRINITY_DN5837_c1_g2_i1:40-819(+)